MSHLQTTHNVEVSFRLKETAALSSEQKSSLNQIASVFKSLGVNFLNHDTLVLDVETVRLVYRKVPNLNLYAKFVQAMEDSGVVMPKTPDFDVALGTGGERYWRFSLIDSMAVNQRTDLPKTITVDELQCNIYIQF